MLFSAVRRFLEKVVFMGFTADSEYYRVSADESRIEIAVKEDLSSYNFASFAEGLIASAVSYCRAACRLEYNYGHAAELGERKSILRKNNRQNF